MIPRILYLVLFPLCFVWTNGCYVPKDIMFSFIDATGKFPSGLESGNLIDLGAFDQCLALDKSVKDTRYRGKYCLVKVSVPLGFKHLRSNTPEPNQQIQIQKYNQNISPISTTIIALSWCIPDSCTIENVTMMNPIYYYPFLPNFRTNISVEPLLDSYCQTQEDMDRQLITWSPADIATVALLGTVGCIMLLSTIYDVFLRCFNKKPVHILLIAFSVRTNGENLLAFSNNQDQLPCLHGIRFISMMWIIYGHRHTVTFLGSIINKTSFQTFQGKPVNMYIMGASVSVDTFLFLSGLLVAYGFFVAKTKGVQFNILMYWLHRYIRLTSSFGVVILIHATILNRFGSGPLWPFTMTILKDVCIKNWWSSLLYIQNYKDGVESCIVQSWYLSIDTQLFFLSPIILLPLWKWPRYTLYASFALLIGSIMSPFIVSYYYDLVVNIVQSTTDPNFNSKYYYVTHTRFGPWLIGVVFGYYIFKIRKNQDKQYKLHPAQICAGWLFGSALMLLILFAQYNLLLEHNRLANAFFNGMHRHAWALCLCWVVYACTEGYAGPINTFLSWPPFQILGRFTYTMYLTHLSLQYLISGASRTTTYYSEFNNIYNFWGDISLTFFISLCLILSFESPIFVIEKVIFKTEGKLKTNHRINVSSITI